MSSFLAFVDQLSPAVAVVPFILFSAVVFVACGKKRPPPKAASKGKKPSAQSLKGKSGKSLRSKRITSSKKLSRSGKSSKSSKKSRKSKRSSREKAAALKQPTGPVPIRSLPAGDVSLKSQATQSISARPAEENKKLEVQPENLRWTPTGGIQSVSVINNTAERQAIKLKCSDNELYRVSPVHAFVESGQRLKVDIMRQNGAPKVDKLVVQTAKAGPADTDAKTFFKISPAGQHPSMVVPLLATA